ncbi:hypothetical protein [Actinokineospora alba]|uniref:hypothetical protein n=1 Tax=Actinokineospora alba TaxID=504798 RepID=UPI000B85B7AB|nr:hypothetical protein [Actinokineospora alba]
MSRRALFRAAGATAATVAVGACTGEPDKPRPPDPLVELAAQARADAEAATAMAALVPPAAEIASIRGEHAKVLQAEVDRERPPVSSSGAPAPTSASPQATPSDAATARQQLLDALIAAEEKASAVVPAVPRYRAGMVGSVAAACASLREVLA